VPLPASTLLSHAEDVGTTSGSLATVGGTPVDITGHHLGMAVASVSMAYTGGSTGLATHTYTPADACVVVSAGTRIRCPAAPGVGANYSFVVTVDGGSSAPSARQLSYTQPTISAIEGPGATLAPAIGGVPIVLRGSNFGPVGDNTTLRVWAVPSANDTLVFPGLGCTVTEAHVAITCTTAPGRGASLTWRVQVEGLTNTVSLSTLAPPNVTTATFADAGVSVASTLGGTALAVFGHNFGDGVQDTVVTVTVPGRVLVTTQCVMVAVDTQLRCLLPPGTGVISHVSVAVLGQSTLLEVAGLAYAPPSLRAVSPSTWATDVATMTIVLRGAGFGSAAHSSLVTVSATGDPGCGSGGPVTVVGTFVSVLNDTELSFVLQGATPHLVQQWTLSVVVAGQGLAGDAASQDAATLRTRAPGVPTLTFAAPTNGTHQFLLLTGVDYGPVVSPCPNDVIVTVGGLPCAALSMTQVRVMPASWGLMLVAWLV
jgi:hypothetical protein